MLYALASTLLAQVAPPTSTKRARVDFKEATDRAGQLGLTQAEIAEVLGIAHSTVRASRLDPSSPNYRKPPDGWKPKLMKAALERGGELAKLAEELEG